MKNVIFAVLALFLIQSCDKAENQPQNPQEVSNDNPAAQSLVQKPLQLKNSNGETVTVTYFAEGDNVAVKISKNGEPEQKLTAKTTNAAGNPIFTNDEYMWEITQEGRAGKLSDKDGNGSEYKEQ